MNSVPDTSAERAWVPQAGLLLAVTLVTFLPSLDAGFVWNDDDLDEMLTLIDDEGLDAVWFSTRSFNYWPVTWTSYWIEHKVFDEAGKPPRPAHYHVINVLVHAVSCLLLWRILVRLGVPGAWLAGLVFAVHPVNVESVAWITQRKNVLSLVFYLATLRWWLDFERHGGRLRYGSALASFLLGMLSKGAVIACPLVLLLLAWWQRGRVGRQDLLRALPFLVIAVLLGISEVWFQHVRAIGSETIRDAGLGERVLATGPICWFYFSRAIVPIDLAFVYPLWQLDVTSVVDWLPLVGLLAVVALLFGFRDRLSRGPVIAVLYYLLCLGPVAGLVDIYFMKYSLVADHYQYIALPGLVALLVGGGTLLVRRHGISQLGGQVIGAGLVAVLAGLTWQQADLYDTPGRLWRDTLLKNPGCWLAHHELGNLLNTSQQADVALAHYRQALTLVEDQRGPGAAESANVHHSLGVLLGQLGRQRNQPELARTALGHLESACRIVPEDIRFLVSLSGVRQENEQSDLAITELKNFLKRQPDSARGWQTLGKLLEAAGRDDEARRAFITAGNLFKSDGHDAEARRAFIAAEQLGPR